MVFNNTGVIFYVISLSFFALPRLAAYMCKQRLHFKTRGSEKTQIMVSSPITATHKNTLLTGLSSKEGTYHPDVQVRVEYQDNKVRPAVLNSK